MEAGDVALVAGGREGGPPHQRVPEAVVEGPKPGAADVELTGIAAALVARHLFASKTQSLSKECNIL